MSSARFPLQSKQFNNSKKFLSSLKDAKLRLGALKTGLKSELQIFRCTCESLLEDIVPASEIEVMVVHPFGTEWKNEVFNRRLRLRLQNSYQVVEE